MNLPLNFWDINFCIKALSLAIDHSCACHVTFTAKQTNQFLYQKPSGSWFVSTIHLILFHQLLSLAFLKCSTPLAVVKTSSITNLKWSRSPLFRHWLPWPDHITQPERASPQKWRQPTAPPIADNDTYKPIGWIGTWHIYLHEWLIGMINIGKYTIHGCYGKWYLVMSSKLIFNLGLVRIHVEFGFNIRIQYNLIPKNSWVVESTYKTACFSWLRKPLSGIRVFWTDSIG